MTMEQLKEQIKAVYGARQAAGQAKVIVNGLREAWEYQNQEIIEAMKQAVIQQSEAEERLRVLTLKAYAETGSKAPAPGVGIREVSTLDYQDSIALEWAKEHSMALQLDKKAFEKIAKASPLDFVTTIIEPQATIATDLSGAVKELEVKP